MGPGAGAVVELEETIAGGALFAEELVGVFRGGGVCVAGGFATVACKREGVSLCCALGHVGGKAERGVRLDGEDVPAIGIADKDERKTYWMCC